MITGHPNPSPRPRPRLQDSRPAPVDIVDYTAGFGDALRKAVDSDTDDAVTTATADVLRLVITVVPGAVGASLALRLRTKNRTAAATDHSAAYLDGLQFRCGDGPTLEVLAQRSTAYSSDLGADRRWPRFGRVVARQTRIRSVWACSLMAGSNPRPSALTIYLAEHAADPTDSELLPLALANAQVAFAGVAQLARARHLHRALSTNSRIGIALGILMIVQDCTEDQALAAMGLASQALNRKINDIADEVVLTGALPDVPVTTAANPTPTH